MGYDLQRTAGGNAWLGGSGTFAQIVDGLKAIAMNRDNLDQTIRDYTDQSLNAAVINRGSTSASNADDVKTPGRWAVNNGTAAAALGLPVATGGVLEVIPWGSLVLQVFSTANGNFQRWQGSTGWHPWVRAAGLPSSDRNSIASTEDLGTYKTPGRWAVNNGTAAAALGLPVATGGVLEVIPWGSLVLQVFCTANGNFQRWQGSTGWHPWVRTDAAEVAQKVERILQSNTGGPAGGIKTSSGMKVLPVSLTLGWAGGDGPPQATVRYPFRVNALITRWRVRIANRNPRYGLTGLERTTPVSFSNLWVGTRVNASGGSTDLKNITQIPNITEGTSETVTPWVSSMEIGGNKEVVFSFGYSAQEPPRANVGGGWQIDSTGKESDADFTGGERKTVMPFHVWVETETYSFTPSIAGFGDSLTCGVGATLPVHDSWVSQHARKISAIPVHYSGSGDYMGGYEDETLLKWQQWAHLDKPDSVIWGMGSNDVFSGTDLAELKRRHTAVAPLVAKYISPTMYAATIMPRTKTDPGPLEETRREYNRWVRSLPNDIRDYFDFAASVSDDDENIRPELNADGIHLNTAGYTANSNAITRLVTSPRVLTA